MNLALLKIFALIYLTNRTMEVGKASGSIKFKSKTVIWQKVKCPIYGNNNCNHPQLIKVLVKPTSYMINNYMAVFNGT
jgi:hypothetical protein